MSVMYQTLTMPSAGTGEKRHSTCPLGTPALQVLSWYTSLTKPVHILEEGNMASEQGFVDSDSCRGQESGARARSRPEVRLQAVMRSRREHLPLKGTAGTQSPRAAIPSPFPREAGNSYFYVKFLNI